MPTMKRFVGVAVIFVAGVVALGCGSSVATRPKATTAPTATTTGPAPTTTTTQPGVESTTTPTYQSGSTCLNGQVDTTSTVGSAGLSHRALVVVFQNVSTSTCVLTGWPGVAGLDAQGAQVAQAAREPNGFNGGGLPTGQTTPPTVTLAPGQMASTTINGLDGPVGTATSCADFASFLVTPPNLTQSQTVSSSPNQGNYVEPFPNCAPIYVTPVVPGTTGALG